MDKTEIENLENQKLEYKRQMKITKPHLGTLGNQFLYWEKKYNEVVKKIEAINQKQ